MLSHLKEAQHMASYARSENVTTQKGTGEKPSQTADDALMAHGRETQKIASYARREDVNTQKVRLASALAPLHPAVDCRPLLPHLSCIRFLRSMPHP